MKLLIALAAALALAVPARAEPPSPGTFVVHAIDVGTGLAVFVEGADFTLLYDAGSNDDTARGADKNRVVAYLRAARPDLERIDHLILSHPHKDHSELMPDVLAAYQVGNLWDSGSLNPICSYRALLTGIAEEPGAQYHHATGALGPHSVSFKPKNCYGKALKAATVTIPRSVQITREPVPLGAGAAMTVLHADGTREHEFNEASVVVRLDLGARRILLPGDAEAGGRRPPTEAPKAGSVEADLLACCAAALRSDILVAGHHGSKTSSRTAFLDAVGAGHYVVSAGPTKYQTVTLPDKEVVDEFERRGAVWRTDIDDRACAANKAKVGPDADGNPGGCDNLRILIDVAGTIVPAYERRRD
jgi:competence protein ComEC